MVFENTGIYEILHRFGIKTEDKISYIVCKKKLETFYITKLSPIIDEDGVFFVEVWHKNDVLQKLGHTNKLHGIIPDAHLQFKGKMTLTTLAKKMTYHRGQGER